MGQSAPVFSGVSLKQAAANGLEVQQRRALHLSEHAPTQFKIAPQSWWGERRSSSALARRRRKSLAADQAAEAERCARSTNPPRPRDCRLGSRSRGARRALCAGRRYLGLTALLIAILYVARDPVRSPH
jgi:hypothetical protein